MRDIFNLLNLKERRRLNAPLSIHKKSLYAGLAMVLIWIGYAVYLVVTSFEIPDRGEALDLLAVALVMFVLGWAAARVASSLIQRLRSRIVAGSQARTKA